MFSSIVCLTDSMFKIFVSFIVPITATSAPINVSLGFISPLDPSLGPLATLGKELVWALLDCVYMFSI